MKQFDLLVFIGRFQPLHNVHIEIIYNALEIAHNTLILVGSANLARNIKNPFTYLERKEMLLSSLPDNLDTYHISPLQDYLYNENRWLLSVQNEVDNFINEKFGEGLEKKVLKIGIIGCNKDASTYYIKSFPNYTVVQTPEINNFNATIIRENYFLKNHDIVNILRMVPPNIINFLTEFRKTDEFKQLVKEKEFITNYKKKFSQLEYPPVFVTTDTLVIQSGNILLVKRKAEPGKGLYALPGGFLNATTDKSLLDCAIRELKEETNIKVPEPILRGNIIKTQCFDAIERSFRGRTITHVFVIQLPDFGSLPKVKGSDDAEKAFWLPLNKLQPDMFFEDHYEIIQSLI